MSYTGTTQMNNRVDTLTQMLEKVIESQSRMHTYWLVEYPYQIDGPWVDTAIDARTKKGMRYGEQFITIRLLDPCKHNPANEMDYKVVVFVDLGLIGVVNPFWSTVRFMTTADTYTAKEYANLLLTRPHKAGYDQQGDSFEELLDWLKVLADEEPEPEQPPTRKQVKQLLTALHGTRPTKRSVTETMDYVKDRLANPDRKYATSVESPAVKVKIPKDGSVPSKEEVSDFFYRQHGVYPTKSEIKRIRQQQALIAGKERSGQ